MYAVQEYNDSVYKLIASGQIISLELDVINLKKRYLGTLVEYIIF